MITRRKFLRNTAVAGVFAAACPGVTATLTGSPIEVHAPSPRKSRFILDMVHDNPGEPPFATPFKDTAFLKSWGYNGQCPRTFVQAAITYDNFDPVILPKGSEARAWTEEMGRKIDAQLRAARLNQMPLYPFTDVLVVPKLLMEKYGARMRDGTRLSILKPMTEAIMREQIRGVFDRFPELGGITVRFGETYLQDTPYHEGGSPVLTAEEHVALIRILRDEICVKRNKIVLYRTWAISREDVNLHINENLYLRVTDAVEPHPNLFFSIKHTQGDFLRDTPFNPTLGAGSHSQIVEVSVMQAGCYGKNAHPYYIGQGVIEGWEEMGAKKKGIKDFANSPLFSGVWTWTRGDGWAGPYITNEFWVRLNAWVISHFAQDTSRTEPELFDEYSRGQLGMDGRNIEKLRELCLLSASATYHGQCSSFWKVPPFWCRDEYLTAIDLKPVVAAGLVKQVLDEKAAAVADWKRIENLSREMRLSNANDQEFLHVSATYGRIKFAIIEQIWIMQILAAEAGDIARINGVAMKKALQVYDVLWSEWKQLKKDYACCPTLYIDERAVNVGPVLKPFLDRYRKQVGLL